jgi:hypothetical protein
MFGEYNRKKSIQNKLSKLAFKIIPVVHNTLLATPKLKYFLWILQFLGPTNQPTHHIFYGPKLNFTLGEFVLLGKLPHSSFTPGAFDHFGVPRGTFCVQWVKIKFYSRVHFFFGQAPKLKLSPCLLHIMGPHWGLLEFRG